MSIKQKKKKKKALLYLLGLVVVGIDILCDDEKNRDDNKKIYRVDLPEYPASK